MEARDYVSSLTACSYMLHASTVQSQAKKVHTLKLHHRLNGPDWEYT
jgi:hypothetical protein